MTITCFISQFLFKNIKIYDLTVAQANILKQTALSVGADCATHREVITGKIENSDAILSGSFAQLNKIAIKLKYQPFGLADLADKIVEQLNEKHTKTKIVGILNITPNSFSDGFMYSTTEKACEHFKQLISDGADIIDIGAESTKPGAPAISAEKQLEKIIQVNNIQNNQNNSLNNSNSNNNSSGTGLNLPLIPTSSNMIPYSQYKKEREELQNTIEKAKKDMNQLTEQNNKLKSRRNVLEKELKSQKEQLTDKIKILIEKSDNDEKLITALKNELLKKGVNVGNFYENETFNLKQEISKLRDQLKQKEKYINEMNAMFIPSTGNKLQKREDFGNSQITSGSSKIDDATLTAVMNRLAELEKENKELKTLGGDGEDTKIAESLARENAKLRMKIADLEDRLANK